MIVRSQKWVGGADGFLELIDQRKLPMEFVKLECSDIDQVFEAIRSLAVRGAPAIGVAAGYGAVLGLRRAVAKDMSAGLETLRNACYYLASSRPTAVNLFWALDRIRDAGEQFAADNPQAMVQELRGRILAEAHAICEEDERMCKQIGENGQHLINDGVGILTHCNAGALATAGQGTALSVLFEAYAKGKRFSVYADETRPLLQGARLTAWELQQGGIKATVICDNMAGWLMKNGKIQAVITGADRIAANGDTANKIGTYSLSILARAHGIPFYVAAPTSTFDLSIKDGGEIPIEERAAEEVKQFAGVRTTPNDVLVYNPAFDVTDAGCITAIITELGVIEGPDTAKVAEHFKEGKSERPWQPREC